MRDDQDAAFARCPHCAERPAAGHHLCPLNLEAEGCECCGACAKICSDVRGHIVLHTPSVFVDAGTGEMLVTYIDEAPGYVRHAERGYPSLPGGCPEIDKSVPEPGQPGR